MYTRTNANAALTPIQDLSQLEIKENQAKAGIAPAPGIKRPPPPQTAGVKPAAPKQRRKKMSDEEVMARLRMCTHGSGLSCRCRIVARFARVSVHE